MIIKKITLDNIRSYEHEEVEFETGSTLLSGDIGCGKTSILLAIEFGLFGLQPGQRGSFLLRNGEVEGGVKLEINVEGKEIIIERTLKRTKTISQDYAAITIDGEKREMAVTELKQKVLTLLNYPLEFSKKQNILYKFTVYTPQEEMKQIVLEDPETRINTLRHIFGIDKYKTILENVGVLRLKLREEKRLMQGIITDLDSDKKLLEEKEKLIDFKKKSIYELELDLATKQEKRKTKESEKEEVTKKIEGKVELKSNLGQATGLLHSKNEILMSNNKKIEILKKEIEEFKSLDFDELKIQNLEEEIFQKKKQKEKLSTVFIETNSKISSFKLKLDDCRHLETKMQNLETCPTCGQDVDAVYRANVLNKNHNDSTKTKNNLEELEIEKESTNKKIKELEIEINLLEKKLTDLKILKMKLSGINEKEKTLNELKNENKVLGEDIKLLRSQIERMKSDLLFFSKYDNLFEEKSKELALELKEERMADIRLAEAKKEIEVFSSSIDELKLRIKKLEDIKEKLDHITELEEWLNKKFTPVVSFIEKNVMVSLKYEFSKLFSEWFKNLVPEGFSVRIGDNFTPIIEQHDYEIDYAYLSGGERTAIALAYRLALNHVINSLMSKIKTKDIVILDEPTDGFSDQQLDKMREVLDELNVKQLIIVSHEQKIEGFVENVIKFKKEFGISSKE
jgi:exonuclease SbcC